MSSKEDLVGLGQRRYRAFWLASQGFSAWVHWRLKIKWKRDNASLHGKWPVKRCLCVCKCRTDSSADGYHQHMLVCHTTKKYMQHVNARQNDAGASMWLHGHDTLVQKYDAITLVWTEMS